MRCRKLLWCKLTLKLNANWVRLGILALLFVWSMIRMLYLLCVLVN